MDRVAHQYGLHPLAVEDALSPQQMPKLDIYQKHLFIVARTATLEPDETLTYGQTAFFLGPDFIISVRFGSERAHVGLRRTLEADPERLAEGADYVLHAILDFIVDGYLPTMESLEAVAHDMEESAIDAFPSSRRSGASSACAASCAGSSGSSGRWRKSASGWPKPRCR
jgi:magnesium transporter